MELRSNDFLWSLGDDEAAEFQKKVAKEEEEK